MPEPLEIGVAQPRCVPSDVAANVVEHATLVRVARVRVLVFPELSLTGYEFGIPRHASDTAGLRIDAYVAGVLEHADDAAVPAERARRIATSHGIWVAMASFAGSTGGGYAPAAGRSGIWSPYGLAVALAGPEAGDIACATLRRPSIGSGPA